MIHRLSLFLILISTAGFSQQIYFSVPFQISTNSTGSTHPRVELIQNQPFVVWGDPGSAYNLFYADWIGGGFNPATQLTHADEMVMLGYAEGPVVKSFGDTVFICYVSMIDNINRVYVRKSTDGGMSFSDTILVNDRSFGNALEYANMTLDESGNPMIVFVRFETGDLPKHVFYRSFDGGNTFTGEINATPDPNTEACECCPATIVSENNMIYCGYRNNDNNIRDFYVSVSENGGLSFDSLRRIDYTNWMTASCPASGASSFISGDSILSVYMTKENNQGMIKANSLHKSNLVPGPEYYVDPDILSATYQMNYPEIAGNLDTLGIVWQDNRSGQVKTYFSYSVNGLNNLSDPILLSDFTTGIHINPHLVFKNKTFHIVWRDYSADIIWYRKASFDPVLLSDTDNHSLNLQIFPNPAQNFISLNIPEKGFIEVMDASGKCIYQSVINTSQKINTETFSPGVYLIKYSSENLNSIQKIIIQR